MPGLPSGRTSSVKAMDKNFILQTEFRIKPKLAIVTSVTLDGQVVHKIERSYLSEINTEEEIKKAEKSINMQHEAIAQKLLANGADFIKQTRSIKISRGDKLGVIPGVSFVADVEEKIQSENPPKIYAQSDLIMKIARSTSSTSRIGKFKAAAILCETGKFILDGRDGRGYLLSLKPDCNIKTTLDEVLE